MIDVEANDVAFYDSPDAGDPDCLCSRCGQPIPEGLVAIRMWPTDDEDAREWRYHPHCQGLDDGDYPEEPDGWRESGGDEWKQSGDS